MYSILTSIKKLLMLTEEDTSFDVDIIMHINTTLAILSQLGVGPPNGFRITDASATWEDFMGDQPNLDDVMSFVYLKVRLMFDPPASSTAADSMNRILGELEWRINVAAESLKRDAEP